MIRKIFKTGHSLAVTIPKKVLEELALNLGDKVSLELLAGEERLMLKKAKKNDQLDLGLKMRHRLGETVPRKE